MMKRKLALLLALLCLFAAMLPACQSAVEDSSAVTDEKKVTAEQMEEKFGMPVVRVVMDLPNYDEGAKDGQLSDALSRLPGYNKEFMLLIETLPREGEERSIDMTRIKTEMMAGKGPDLFLCGQDTYGVCGLLYGGRTDPFFPFPERAMENRLFLPLDDYIENAEYMEWDKFLPVIMDAGKNAEGQQIIPLSYTFSALYADREKYGLLDFDRSMTLSEMWQSDNPALRYASYTSAPFMVGRITEPGDDEPMFTEEELLGYIRDYDMRIPGDPKDYQDLQEDEKVYKGTIMRGFLPEPGLISPVPDRFVLGNGSPAYRIIPAKNARGGVTAVINEFAAINRNARHPDLAFKIIDYLMDAKNQQGSDFFYSRVSLGMPVHMDLGSEEYPLRDKNWYMSAENFEEFCAARAEITEAKFIGPADQALWDIESYDEKGLEKSVHQQYTLIEMLLAES